MLTSKQKMANGLLGSDARHILLYGGSRSGKTFLILRAIAARSLKAPGARHAVLRFRLNHLVASIIHDTWPRVLEALCPHVPVKLDKQALFATFPNGSQVWFGGLDDKERVEKVLGQEHAGIFLNECSQISYEARNVALTRLAQKVDYVLDGTKRTLAPRMYYDENPPLKSHWTYRLFFDHTDPIERTRLAHPEHYAAMQMNPEDNAEHLGEGYIETLQALPPRLRKRFLLGEFGDANPNAFWSEETIERWRLMDGELPDMLRIVVAVDPSGADDDSVDADDIGIAVVGLGVDGVGYLLEDLTLKAGPARWGKVATQAFDRWKADRIVAEGNFGGAMVEHVIKTARPGTPFRLVKASRGKVVRAEPISALYEDGRIRHAGEFHQLEEELYGFASTGYMGDASPNRADAAIWGFSDLFPGIVSGYKSADERGTIEVDPWRRAAERQRQRPSQSRDWVV